MHELAALMREMGLPAVFAVAVLYLFIKWGNAMFLKWDILLMDLKVFMTKVKEEHAASQDHHEALMKQHEEMIQTLGRINGFKNDK